MKIMHKDQRWKVNIPPSMAYLPILIYNNPQTFADVDMTWQMC